jgi:S1-C subfamily serine protease
MATQNAFTDLSDAMAEAVSRAAQYTVLVNARRRYPASGVIYATDLVLTADHVVERDEDITVLTADGRELPATVAGRDSGSDLALLRVNGSLGQAAELASGEAKVGQLTLALGRPSNEGVQASLGVISAVGGPVRTRHGGLVERYLATDAIPYPGFSGGPLIDAAGRLLGLNTSGLARGTSLAIPAETAWRAAEALSTHGHIARGYLGIRSQPVELPANAQQALGRDQNVGLLIVGIEKDSPSANILMVGDILVGIAGHAVHDPDELVGYLTGSMVGKSTPIEILRGGQPTTVQVVVGERR